MKDVLDSQASDISPFKRSRGRPSSGFAMSNAERQKRYRQNLKIKSVTVTEKGQSVDESLRIKLNNMIQEVSRLNRALTEQTQQYDIQAGMLVEYSKQISNLKGQCTKYRNKNKMLREKIQHLESLVSEGKL
jgi:septal ring factor EnvC (AmiA/AmiB activator)